MGKLKVKDIEDRLCRGILHSTGNGGLADSVNLGQAIIALINAQEMTIARQAGQIAAYQSIEANIKYPKDKE